MRYFGKEMLAILLILSATTVHADVTEPLANDEQTIGLWRFDSDPAEGFPDLSGHGRDARVHPQGADVRIVPVPAELADHFTSMLMIDKGAIVLPDIGEAIQGGAFTIEMRGKLDRDGQIFRTTDWNSPTIGYLSRAAGWLALTQYNRADDGKLSPKINVDRKKIAESFGRIYFERYYHIAITYDGKRTFSFYLDGNLLTEIDREGEGDLYFHRGDVILGYLSKFNGTAIPSIVECRISSTARTFSPRQIGHPENLTAAIASHAVRLDMTTTDSPVAESFLGVAPGVTYAADRGYGWTSPAIAGFDSWYVGGWFKY